MLFFSKEGSGRISQLWIVQLDAASWKAWRVQHIKGYYFTEHVICSEWTFCMSANHLKLIYFSFCLTYCIRTSANQVPFISSVIKINILPCSEVGLDLELKQLPALHSRNVLKGCRALWSSFLQCTTKCYTIPPSPREAVRNFKRSLVQQHFCCTGLPVGVFLGLAVGECEKKLPATRDICTWERAPEAIHLPWLEVRINWSGIPEPRYSPCNLHWGLLSTDSVLVTQG